MSVQTPHCDADVLRLLHVAGPLRVSDIAESMEVTATAVRQRLQRMQARGYIGRETVRTGRGRPRHEYGLTDKGLQENGSDFVDLATRLANEVRSIEDRDSRREALRRIARAFVAGYARENRRKPVSERMHVLRELLSQHFPAISVPQPPEAPMLLAHSSDVPTIAGLDVAEFHYQPGVQLTQLLSEPHR